jgi:hypothetical protein
MRSLERKVRSGRVTMMNARQKASQALWVCGLVWLASGHAQAQDYPKRKPGLWQMQMQMPGMPAGMKAQHCIDEKTDAEMQRKALAGDPRQTCTQKSMKKTADGFEAEAECNSAEGKSVALIKASGDWGSRYRVDTQMRFTPARHGMTEARMQIEATHLGACPAGMLPGQINMAGLPLAPGANRPAGGPPGSPGQLPPNLQGMSPEQLRQLAEQMKKASGK